MAQESAELERLQKQLLQQERELSQQAAQLAKDAAEADVKSREAGRLVAQVGLTATTTSVVDHNLCLRFGCFWHAVGWCFV